MIIEGADLIRHLIRLRAQSDHWIPLTMSNLLQTFMPALQFEDIILSHSMSFEDSVRDKTLSFLLFIT